MESPSIAALALSLPSPAEGLQAPLGVRDPSQIIGTEGPPEATLVLSSNRSTTILQQDPLPLARAQKWAAFVNVNLDILIYTPIFLFLNIPIYYSAGYVMPIQLSFNILAYFTALQLLTQWRRFLHPILVSSLITVLGVRIFALIRWNSLDNALHAYKTGTKYT